MRHISWLKQIHVQSNHCRKMFPRKKPTRLDRTNVECTNSPLVQYKLAPMYYFAYHKICANVLHNNNSKWTNIFMVHVNPEKRLCEMDINPLQPYKSCMAYTERRLTNVLTTTMAIIIIFRNMSKLWYEVVITINISFVTDIVSFGYIHGHQDLLYESPKCPAFRKPLLGIIMSVTVSIRDHVGCFILLQTSHISFRCFLQRNYLRLK